MGSVFGGGGGGGTQTIEQQTDPWSGQQPYLSGLYQSAFNLPQQQPYPYPGVVPPSRSTAMAEIAMANRALQGSPVQASGLAQNLATTRGDYLYGGPGFNAALNAARDVISPMVQGQFAAGGRYGGGLHQAEETRQLANAFASLYGDERQRQMQASMMSPALAASEYQDIERLAQVGAAQEMRGREALQDAMGRWQFQQEAPYQRLGFASNIIQGGYPGSSSRQDYPNQRTSPLAGAMGGGLLGVGATSMPFFAAGGTGAAFAPYLPLIGAGLGFLGGL